MDERGPSKRKRRAVESRSRIYEAAIAVITEKGFEATSIKDIVARAGVSVGAFYHHFASKEAILEENFRLADERFTHLIMRSRQTFRSDDDKESDETGWIKLQGATAVESIVDYFGRYGRFVETITGLDLSLRIYTPKNKLFVRKGRPMQTVLAAIIAESVATGELRTDLSPEKASEWLFIGARGVAFHWCLKDGSFNLESAMRDYSRRALRALEPLD
jgi:TetR/AcrR family transcriptional regulator, fatty acid metabolism regulator protein